MLKKIKEENVLNVLFVLQDFFHTLCKENWVTWNCIAPNGGFRPSDKEGGGGVIHTRIEGGPGLDASGLSLVQK